MAFGGGYDSGRTRMGTMIYLNLYDLSPANDYLYPIGFGIHHSGIEIMGREYSYGSGGGIFETPPKVAPGAKFREQITLGSFDGGTKELNRALDELRNSDGFGSDNYNLVRRNCNHFANALCWKLLKKPIPGYVNRLADIGVCCSCLLPRHMLEEAPVDPNKPSAGFSMHSPPGRTGMHRGTATSASASTFSGTGHSLGSTSSSGGTESEGLLSRWMKPATSNNSRSSQDDLTDRREKARKAALARLERNNLSPTKDS